MATGFDRLLRDLGRLATVAERLTPVMHEYAEIVVEEAKERIGTYQEGWPELAAATQAERARQGYAPDQPLLRSGALRDDIQILSESEREIDIGVPPDAPSAPYATLQERGSLDGMVPARPFLGPALQKHEEEIGAAAAAVVRGELL